MTTFDQDAYDQSVIDYDSGIQALESGDYHTALSRLETSLGLCENCKTYFYISKALTGLGRHEEALAAMRSAHKSNPNHSQIATAYAEMVALEGDAETALSILDAVIEHNKTYNPAKRLQTKIRDSATEP